MQMNSGPSILIVEDGQSEREALARVLRLEGYRVMAASMPDRAMELIDEPIDLVVSDMRLGKQSAIDLLRAWHSRHPETPFILMTAYGDVDSAVTAMKLGAEDFLSKPVAPRQLLSLIEATLNKYRRRFSAQRPGGDAALENLSHNIFGRSKIMADICDQTLRAAATDSTVLILGESGTGKELIAEAMQAHSPRAGGPFVLVNMAAIPE